MRPEPEMIPVLIDAAKALRGSQKRLFMAKTVQAMDRGGQRWALEHLGWCRDTIRKGTHELRSGMTCVDAFSARRRKPAEEHLPRLLDDKPEKGSELFLLPFGHGLRKLGDMPRPPRPVGDRLVYHVINRAPVFHDDGDYAAFLDALRDLKRSRPFECYGYCLMPNHVHLQIRTTDAPISRLMQKPEKGSELFLLPFPVGLRNLGAMARPPRPLGDRLVYHVINRGNNREPVFHHDGDYAAFLDALRDLKRTRPFEFYGYCLMPNHVHLLIRTLDAPISRLMQSLLVTHTQRYHRCHRTSGHLWQGRFKSPVIQDDDHLLTVLRYIEANPLRARLAPAAADYPWSSFPEHGTGRPSGLLDPVIAYEALAADPAERRRLWSAFVHQAPPDDELAALRRSVQTGLPFGSHDWVEQLGRDLGIDLEVRPRGRPRKSPPPTQGGPVATADPGASGTG